MSPATFRLIGLIVLAMSALETRAQATRPAPTTLPTERSPLAMQLAQAGDWMHFAANSSIGIPTSSPKRSSSSYSNDDWWQEKMASQLRRERPQPIQSCSNTARNWMKWKRSCPGWNCDTAASPRWFTK